MIPPRDTPYNSVSFSARLLSLWARVTLAVLVLIYMPAAACGPSRPRPAVSDGRLCLALHLKMQSNERCLLSPLRRESDDDDRWCRGGPKSTRTCCASHLSSPSPFPSLPFLTSRFISHPSPLPLFAPRLLRSHENSLKFINLLYMLIIWVIYIFFFIESNNTCKLLWISSRKSICHFDSVDSEF